MQLLAAFRFREFRLLWLSVATANSGRWVMAMGVGSLLYDLTHASAWIGASMFLVQAPSLVVAPIAGVLADRVDRRFLLTFGLALATVASGALVALTALGIASTPAVLLCVLLLGISFGFQGTASSALVPRAIPRDSLANGIALLGTARQGAEFLGPALAAPLLLGIGPSGVFALAFLCYAGATALPLRLRPHAPAPGRAYRHAFEPLEEGLRYLVATPILWIVAVLVALHCGLTMTYQGLLPAFARASLGRGDGAYSSLMTAVGFGAMAGTLGLAAIARHRLYSAAYVVTAAASGLALAGFGAAHSLPAALAGAALAGAAQASFMAVSLTLLQEVAHPAFLGRVTGVYNFIASGAMAALSWGFGAVATATAPAPVMLAGGVAFTCVVVAAGLAWPQARRLFRNGVALPSVPVAAR